MKEKDTEEKVVEVYVDKDDLDSQAEPGSDESSGMPDYVGPPRVVIVARPSAYAYYQSQIMTKVMEWDYEIINTKEYTFTEEEAEVYYGEFKNMSIFSKIIAEVTSRPSFVIVARKEVSYRFFYVRSMVICIFSFNFTFDFILNFDKNSLRLNHLACCG